MQISGRSGRGMGELGKLVKLMANYVFPRHSLQKNLAKNSDNPLPEMLF